DGRLSPFRAQGRHRGTRYERRRRHEVDHLRRRRGAAMERPCFGPARPSFRQLTRVPGLTLQTDAIVLLKRPPGDTFQTCTVFSGEHGNLTIMQRLPKKSGGALAPLDLFDEASLLLESSNQGHAWFVKEARLLHRAT